MPEGISANAEVRVVVEAQAASKPRCLEEIAEMAVDADLPRDFSTQFVHYTKGFLRK